MNRQALYRYGNLETDNEHTSTLNTQTWECVETDNEHTSILITQTWKCVETDNENTSTLIIHILSSFVPCYYNHLHGQNVRLYPSVFPFCHAPNHMLRLFSHTQMGI